jgi:hypothetical protein
LPPCYQRQRRASAISERVSRRQYRSLIFSFQSLGDCGLAVRVFFLALFAPGVGAALRCSGLTHDALDHHGRDAREHGLGHRGMKIALKQIRIFRPLAPSLDAHHPAKTRCPLPQAHQPRALMRLGLVLFALMAICELSVGEADSHRATWKARIHLRHEHA